ncbi:hypothetical protein [Streptomyces sp. NPDC093970]|uniref:hypothetical protein n=1 Tax=Streptomyces sp. NPDC093970 TaxID=3155076 RepID=UPI0034406880
MPVTSPSPGPAVGDTDVLVTQMVDELTRLLTLATVRPPADPVDVAGEARWHALLRLRVLAEVKQTLRHLEDETAHAAAASGAGYPEIGRAVSMSRQGARRRWPGLVTNSTDHSPRPTHRSS